MQVRALGDRDTREGPQKRRIREEQRRRNVTVDDQAAPAIDIREEKIEQLGPLNNSRLDEAPLLRWDQQRDWIDCQRPAGALRVGIDVVGVPVNNVSSILRGLGLTLGL